MNKTILPIIIVSMALSACTRKSDTYTQDYMTDTTFVECAEAVALAPAQSAVRYSVPNNSDLFLETAHHVIQIEGAQNQSYKYYVWAGGKDYADDPDLIVEDGAAAVLVEE